MERGEQKGRREIVRGQSATQKQDSRVMGGQKSVSVRRAAQGKDGAGGEQQGHAEPERAAREVAPIVECANNGSRDEA